MWAARTPWLCATGKCGRCVCQASYTCLHALLSLSLSHTHTNTHTRTHTHARSLTDTCKVRQTIVSPTSAHTHALRGGEPIEDFFLPTTYSSCTAASVLPTRTRTLSLSYCSAAHGTPHTHTQSPTAWHPVDGLVVPPRARLLATGSAQATHAPSFVLLLFFFLPL